MISPEMLEKLAKKFNQGQGVTVYQCFFCLQYKQKVVEITAVSKEGERKRGRICLDCKQKRTDIRIG